MMSSISLKANCNDKVEVIYGNIVEAIGNQSLLTPDLFFSDEKNSVAYMNADGITIEQKVIDIFCGQSDFEDRIAYILAHELAHYYLEHNWIRNSGLSYANSIGEFLQDNSYSIDQRKLAESQADLYAGFYAQIAGYKALSHAESTLATIYREYELSKDLKGYPSFDERVTIINSKIKTANELAQVFDIANVLLQKQEFYLAKDYYELILNNKFNSREIYNNLGLTYLLYGISISKQEISQWVFPVSLDQTTRAEISSTRSGSLFDDPRKMIQKAQQNFKRAMALDSSYMPSKFNHVICDVLLQASSKERLSFIDKNDFIQKYEKFKYDLLTLDELIESGPSKKARRLAKKGSKISELNFETPSVLDTSHSQEKLLSKLGIELGDLFFSGNSKKLLGSKISKGKISGYTYYKVDKLYLFVISNDVYEGLNVDEQMLILSTLNNKYFVFQNS
jgi:hypothetical protein